MMPIEQIGRGTTLLTDEDLAYLATAADELRDTLHKRQIFRTRTEMEISVLNDIKHPTGASKYWQAVREQAVMLDNLVTLTFDARRNDVRIRRLTDQLAANLDEYTRDERQIDLDECLYRRTNMELVARDRIRELRLWSGIKASLDDGGFDTQDVDAHQLVSYAHRFILQAATAPKDMPVAEASNLHGQLQSALRILRERDEKLLGELIDALPSDVVSQVMGSALLPVG